VREAAWLTTEEAETTIDRHEAYVLSPEFFRRAKGQTGLVVLGVLFLVVAFAAAVASTDLIPLAMVSVAALSLGAIPLAHFWELRQTARREPDLALKEGFGKGPGRFVELIVLQGSAPTGIDRGMLWIEDRRLYFSGHRTSFGLVPWQVRSLTGRDAPIPGIRHAITLELQHETPAGLMSLSFGLIVPPSVSDWSERHDLLTQLDRWKGGHNPGEGQWPPSGLGPGVVSERRLFLGAVLSSAFFPVTITAWSVAVGNPLLLIGIPIAAIAWLGNEKTRARWRAVRDRRRLRRLQ